MPMKRFVFSRFMLVAVAAALLSGCDNPDMLRANPVSFEVDGTYFRTNPDKPYFGVIIVNENTPDAYFKQKDDYFVFGINDYLYDSKGNVCQLNVDFVGWGVPELGVRYSLVPLDSEEFQTFRMFLKYGNEEYGIADGWVEFSEFGINSVGDRAYTSGTFGITLKNRAMKITDGRFGRMLECSYHNERTPLE